MKIFRLLALLPFYIPAFLLAVIAGTIGADSWHVSMGLRQHRVGDPAKWRVNVVVEPEEESQT